MTEPESSLDLNYIEYHFRRRLPRMSIEIGNKLNVGWISPLDDLPSLEMPHPATPIRFSTLG